MAQVGRSLLYKPEDLHSNPVTQIKKRKQNNPQNPTQGCASIVLALLWGTGQQGWWRGEKNRLETQKPTVPRMSVCSGRNKRCHPTRWKIKTSSPNCPLNSKHAPSHVYTCIHPRPQPKTKNKNFLYCERNNHQSGETVY